jgi:hypothetical protein
VMQRLVVVEPTTTFMFLGLAAEQLALCFCSSSGPIKLLRSITGPCRRAAWPRRRSTCPAPWVASIRNRPTEWFVVGGLLVAGVKEPRCLDARRPGCAAGSRRPPPLLTIHTNASLRAHLELLRAHGQALMLSRHQIRWPRDSLHKYHTTSARITTTSIAM